VFCCKTVRLKIIIFNGSLGIHFIFKATLKFVRNLSNYEVFQTIKFLLEVISDETIATN
jgi:hypothetical protein